jgi:hypothetical protein
MRLIHECTFQARMHGAYRVCLNKHLCELRDATNNAKNRNCRDQNKASAHIGGNNVQVR